MRKIRFAEGETYHVYNRGVEKRNIFLDNEDYFRFIHDLFEFNDEAPAANIYYKKEALTNQNQSYETKSRKIELVRLGSLIKSMGSTSITPLII